MRASAAHCGHACYNPPPRPCLHPPQPAPSQPLLGAGITSRGAEVQPSTGYHNPAREPGEGPAPARGEDTVRGPLLCKLFPALQHSPKLIPRHHLPGRDMGVGRAGSVGRWGIGCLVDVLVPVSQPDPFPSPDPIFLLPESPLCDMVGLGVAFLLWLCC